jgi:hypothetical protein
MLPGLGPASAGARGEIQGCAARDGARAGGMLAGAVAALWPAVTWEARNCGCARSKQGTHRGSGRGAWSIQGKQQRGYPLERQRGIPGSSSGHREEKHLGASSSGGTGGFRWHGRQEAGRSAGSLSSRPHFRRCASAAIGMFLSWRWVLILCISTNGMFHTRCIFRWFVWFSRIATLTVCTFYFPYSFAHASWKMCTFEEKPFILPNVIICTSTR